MCDDDDDMGAPQKSFWNIRHKAFHDHELCLDVTSSLSKMANLSSYVSASCKECAWSAIVTSTRRMHVRSRLLRLRRAGIIMYRVTCEFTELYIFHAKTNTNATTHQKERAPGGGGV